jgi:hypothetical protein
MWIGLQSFVACILLAGAGAWASNWFAATDGQSGNSGTISSPWDLPSALQKTSSIQAGDTLYLRGGTYGCSSMSCTLTGTSGSPIVVRPYTGERVVIDGTLFGATQKSVTILALNCSYVRFYDLEFMNSDPLRLVLTWNPGGDESNRPEGRGCAIMDYGTGTAGTSIISPPATTSTSPTTFSCRGSVWPFRSIRPNRPYSRT